MKQTILLMLAAFLLQTGSVQGAPITIDSGEVRAAASTGFSGSDWYDPLAASLFNVFTTETVAVGTVSTTAEILLSDDGFTIDGTHVLDAQPNSSLFTQFRAIVFSVTEDLTYELSGMIEIAGQNRVKISATLHDQADLFTPLFSGSSESSNTANELLNLGGTDGEINTNTGSLTGSLLAGHSYRLNMTASVKNAQGSFSGASSAESTLSLAFRSQVIPTPAAAGLGLPLLCLLGMTRPRRRVAA